MWAASARWFDMPPSLNFGHLIEGVVEQDPMTDHYVIRTEVNGRPVTFDVMAALARLCGREVRLTLASLENLARLAELVEQQGGGQVVGIYPDDINREIG